MLLLPVAEQDNLIPTVLRQATLSWPCACMYVQQGNLILTAYMESLGKDYWKGARVLELGNLLIPCLYREPHTLCVSRA